MTSREIVRKFISENGLRTGDAILTKITPLNWSKHYILILDADNLTFIQNTSGIGVNRPTMDMLVKELKDFQRIMLFQGNEYERQLTVERALEIERRKPKYYLALYNCEDFVWEAWTGVASSSQVDFAASLGLVIGLGTLMVGVAKKNKFAKAIGGTVLLLSAGTLIVRQAQRNKVRILKPRYSY